MNRIVFPIWVTVLLYSVAFAADEEERILASRLVVKEFAGELKSELKKAMKSSGPIQAIDVCKRIAPEIAARVSERTGWQVGRTALKVRNPANTPDAWERRVLEDFEKRKASGQDPKEMEDFAIVEYDGKRYFRYMKVIPTDGACLICHGNNIEESLRERLDTLYPKDQARGFRPGDIRGAFTITQPM